MSTHGTNATHDRVAVIAHNGKVLDGGLTQFREELCRHRVHDPLWFEVPKSKKAPARVREALEKGATTLIVWGGDGMVQRCLDAVAHRDVVVGIIPAGTANLLASNLGIPIDLEKAVDIALHGVPRVLDLGKMNGEHFAVMAGTGLDALMIKDADRGLKERFGRAAYVWTAARHTHNKPVATKVKVDDRTWFDGDASCVLIGNVSDIAGGITAFDNAVPDDGRLDLAVITANGMLQWARALTRTAVGHADRSPLVQVTTAKRIEITTKTSMPYELDGGARPKTKHLKVKVVPKAVTVRVAP